MDILALPDVFLREVLKVVTIKERLKLRLTCRAFEKLVAEKDGCVHRGTLTRAPKRYYPDRPDDISLILQLDDLRVKHIDLNEEGVEKFLQVRNRLFNAIYFNIFEFDLDDDTFDLEFIRKLIHNFKIGNIRFQLGSEDQLEKALKLMADYPESECTTQLWFLPAIDKLLAIPPIRYLKITAGNENFPNQFEVFFKLLSIHKSLWFGVQIEKLTVFDFKDALELLSADNRKRRVKFQVARSAFVRILRECGMNESSKVGDKSGGFEVLVVRENFYADFTLMHLRFKRCVMEITYIDWIGGTRSIDVDVANCDQF